MVKDLRNLSCRYPLMGEALDTPSRFQCLKRSTNNLEHSILALQKQLSADEQLLFQRQYDDEKKSLAAGFAFAGSPLGLMGTHWFWLGNQERGMLYLMLFLGGLVTSFLIIGIFVVAGVGIACIVDEVSMADTIRSHNRKLGKKVFDEVVALRSSGGKALPKVP